MGLITIICFLMIAITISITLAAASIELITKGGLASADPIHLICLMQVIQTVVMVAGLLILEGWLGMDA